MRRSPLLVVYLTVFVDLLAFGIILPILPYYAQSFGATGVWVGALLTAYSAAQFVSAPLLGRLSDRVGRRPILLASLAGSALSLALTGLAHTLALLLIGRLLAGLFGGSIATAQAYIADVTEPARRARYMGLLGAAIGLGFVFGPGLGAGLSHLGFGAAAFVAAGIAAANSLFGLFALVESRPAGRTPSERVWPTPARLAAALARPALGRILGATFLTTFAFVGMETTFALLGKLRFGLNAGGLGLVFTYVGLIAALVQGGLIGRLSARYGERSLAATGAGIMGAALVCIAVAASLGMALVALGALALGQGLASPALSSLLSQESGAHEHGATLGLGQSLAALARAVGPIVAGWLYDRGVALPYVLGALLMVLAAWLVTHAAMPVAAALVREREAVEL